MVKKLGKNFATEDFSKDKDKYPAKELLVKNLNKMIAHTGKYTWNYTNKESINLTAKDLGLDKGSYLKGEFDRKGFITRFTGTFKGLFNPTNDAAWVIITLTDVVPDNYNSYGDNSVSVNTTSVTATNGSISSGGNIVFVSKGNLCVAAPTDKKNMQEIAIDVSYPSGPALYSKTSKMKPLSMSDKVSVNMINTIFEAFSNSSAKMPTRPGSNGITSKKVTMSSDSNINSGYILVRKSSAGTTLVGVMDLKANGAPSSVYKYNGVTDNGYKPKDKIKLQANLTKEWVDDQGLKQTLEWLPNAYVFDDGHVEISVPDSFKEASTQTTAIYTLSFNAYW